MPPASPYLEVLVRASQNRRSRPADPFFQPSSAYPFISSFSSSLDASSSFLSSVARQAASCRGTAAWARGAPAISDLEPVFFSRHEVYPERGVHESPRCPQCEERRGRPLGALDRRAPLFGSRFLPGKRCPWKPRPTAGGCRQMPVLFAWMFLCRASARSR